MAAPSRRIVVKTSHRASILAIAIVALSGCAGMQDKSAMNPNRIVDDSAYIAQVEHLARSRGVSVHWVNPPQRHVADLQHEQ
jgi:hypothetical protein